MAFVSDARTSKTKTKSKKIKKERRQNNYSRGSISKKLSFDKRENPPPTLYN
jgi:hypothetical protein